MGGSKIGDDGRDSNRSSVEVLIGLDMYWEVVSGRFVNNRMRAVALVFGNTMPGPVEINPANGTSESTASFYKNISCKSPPIIEETLHKFCPFESLRVMEKKTAKTNFVRDITLYMDVMR